MKIPQKNCSFVPLPAKENDLKDNGEFQKFTKLLLDNYPSFSLQDCISLTRGAGLDYGDVQRWFESWTAKLVRSGVLKRIQGAYAGEIFLVETV